MSQLHITWRCSKRKIQYKSWLILSYFGKSVKTAIHLNWMKSHPILSLRHPLVAVNSLSIFLWTCGSIVESLLTLSNKKITWVQFHPGTPAPSDPSYWFKPHIDLPLDLGKYRGKFDDNSYYRDWMLSEQTDNKHSSLYIYRYTFGYFFLFTTYSLV